MKVLHFVTGGFSGATQVAVDLCEAAQRTPGMEVLLVLRRKRSTSMERIDALRARGLQVRVVSNWLHVLTVWELRRIIRVWNPDVVFAHGFSDHIWGRQAAVAEGVPRIFHVEHNSRERYTRRRLRQALALAPHTQASIGVSEGVRTSLIERGFAPEQCIAIPNGIVLERFPDSLLPARWQDREPAILMASRFARQKDHASLIHALALLRDRGLAPMLYLAGAGSQRLLRQAQALARRLGLQAQVRFLGNVADLPERLAATQVFVLSTRWEGMPLALVEAMAAGCACIGTDVVGVREVIDQGRTGLLVSPGDTDALADALQRLLQDASLAERLGAAARAQALNAYGHDLMWQRYRALLFAEGAP
ncbi:glycosyl transferase [Acidovorax carolinensis]|uniref:Glycosyl transferase n=1 Tax=Acidovorax carolinensis TaxID=553814 RepID=A0A240TZH7_9BURK|nr:glycosyltransferase [Acidovorax carolinensis]ART50518.1 glycosyl transferase [Acidovorax carolinensis]